LLGEPDKPGVHFGFLEHPISDRLRAVEEVWGDRGSDGGYAEAVLPVSGLRNFKRLNHLDDWQPVADREFPIFDAQRKGRNLVGTGHRLRD